MEPDDLLCSRNARPQKALVGRAQWKIIQPPSLRDNERAWKEHLFRSMRAVKASPATPYQEKILPCSRESALITYDAVSNGLKLRSVQGVLSISRLACSHSRSFLRSISNSAVADVVPLSMPHRLRMYCFVMG